MSNTITTTAATFIPTTVEVNGKVVTLVSGEGWTGKPAWNKFVPGVGVNPITGRENEDRLHTSLCFQDENGEPLWFKATFWGEAARNAKGKLVDSQRTALIKLKNARLSSKPYIGKDGSEKYSVNINFTSQFKEIESSEHFDGMNVETEDKGESSPQSNLPAIQQAGYYNAPF